MGKNGAKNAGKKVPAAPLAAKQTNAKKDSVFQKTARNFRIGGDIQPKRDLTRFVKWPKYVRLQRQKRILLQRLKVPPTIAQFQHTLDKNQFTTLARLMKKLQPETKAQKKERLQSQAGSNAAGKDGANKSLPVLKYGINHVTQLVEDKKAKLVVIAHDVDPVEIVCWLPALCRKMEVPYCIVKGKSRLGQLVHKKAASCLAITTVEKADQKDLDQICGNMMATFNDNHSLHRKWGGGIMGVKSQHIITARQLMLEKEQAKKTGLVM